jgi:hypothetical protein
LAIEPPGNPYPPVEQPEDRIDLLPRDLALPQQGRMARIGIVFQGIEISDQSSTERIEVNVAHQFQKIWVLLAEDGLVSILKERAVPTMAAVVGNSISGEKPGHDGSQGDSACLQEEVNMVGQQGPGITGRRGFGQEASQAIQEIPLVLIVLEDALSLDPTQNEVVEGTGIIEAGLSGHGGRIANRVRIVNL